MHAGLLKNHTLHLESQKFTCPSITKDFKWNSPQLMLIYSPVSKKLKVQQLESVITKGGVIIEQEDKQVP